MRETTHTEFKEKQDEEGKGMYYVWDEIVSDAEKKGIGIGEARGMNYMGRLAEIMFNDGRMEDFRKCLSDATLRDHYMAQYGIISA